MASKPSFVGKRYKQVDSDNFDAYMGILEVNYILRKVGNRVKSLTVFTVDDDGNWTLFIDNVIVRQTLKFRLNEEIDEQTLDGRHVKTIFKLEGNTMIQEQRGEKYTTVVRTYEGDTMTAVLTCEDVVAKIIGKALE